MNLRALHGRLLGKFRAAQLEGRPHLVVPVIALVEGVIHASNATEAELVTAEELAKSVMGWNGRPLVLNHPETGPYKISANEPKVLEEYRIGQIFNMELKDKKLQGEAWIDLERAARVAGGTEMVERIKKEEVVEVSVGAFVQTVPRKGVHQPTGKKYDAVWARITADHLALLPEGLTGACSVAAGCGVRAASGQLEVCMAQNQPRDKTGRWTDHGVGAAVRSQLDKVFASPSYQDLTPGEKKGLEDFLMGGPSADAGLLPTAKSQFIATGILRKVKSQVKRRMLEGEMNRGERIAALLARDDVERGDGAVTRLLALSDDEFDEFEALVAEPPTLIERVLGKKKPMKKVPTAYSDTDLRHDLEAALRSEAGFVGLDQVYPENQEIIYMVMAGDKVRSYRRGYDKQDDTFSFGEPEEVEAVTRYEPKAARARTACGCQGERRAQAKVVRPGLRFRAAMGQNQPRDKEGKWTDGAGSGGAGGAGGGSGAGSGKPLPATSGGSDGVPSIHDMRPPRKEGGLTDADWDAFDAKVKPQVDKLAEHTAGKLKAWKEVRKQKGADARRAQKDIEKKLAEKGVKVEWNGGTNVSLLGNPVGGVERMFFNSLGKAEQRLRG